MSSALTDWLETEHKFEVDADFALPDLTGLAPGHGVAGPAIQQLTASYFDTADLRLAAAGRTLRRRTGGTDAGWHLKLPVAAGTRRELQAPLGPADGAVPGELTAQLTGLTSGQPVQVIAILETTRSLRQITGPDGQVLAEVADDLVTGRQPGTGTALTWREIEVELISGTPDILAAVGARLRAAGARPSRSASKLSRLLSAAGTARPAGA